MLSVFLYLVSQTLMNQVSCVSETLQVWETALINHDSNGQISLWPVSPGKICHVSDARILSAMDFIFSWKQLETDLVTLKSFTCCVTVASGCEPAWDHEGPSFEQPQELWALTWNGMLDYVQSHGNLNLAALSASEITSASQPSAPVTRVDLGVGCRLRNLF